MFGSISGENSDKKPIEDWYGIKAQPGNLWSYEVNNVTIGNETSVLSGTYNTVALQDIAVNVTTSLPPTVYDTIWVPMIESLPGWDCSIEPGFCINYAPGQSCAQLNACAGMPTLSYSAPTDGEPLVVTFTPDSYCGDYFPYPTVNLSGCMTFISPTPTQTNNGDYYTLNYFTLSLGLDFEAKEIYLGSYGNNGITLAGQTTSFGLGTWALIGIIAGGVVGLALIGVGIACCIKRAKASKAGKSEANEALTDKVQDKNDAEE